MAIYMVGFVYMMMRKTAVVVACVLASVGLDSCCQCGNVPQPTPQEVAKLKLVTRSYRVNGKRYVPMDVCEALGYKEEGIATYYDDCGTRGAYGEVLRAGTFYAAHKTLPMPCTVRVTNLSNGKSCEVRVIDRGPFTRNRLIDVSRPVARHLGFIGKGVQKVRVEVVAVGDGPNQLKAE